MPAALDGGAHHHLPKLRGVKRSQRAEQLARARRAPLRITASRGDLSLCAIR